MKIKKVNTIKDLLLPKDCSASNNSVNEKFYNASDALEADNSHNVNNPVEAGDADLILTTNEIDCNDIYTLKKKFLQEKKCCEKYEELINDLKNIAVQLLERVTTALDVDKAKNKEIDSCYAGLIEATNEIVKINGEKEKFEQYYQQQLNKYDEELSGALINVTNYEQQAAKSFQLACDYEKELSKVENLNIKLIERLGKIEKTLIDLESKYIAKIESNKQLHELLLQKDEKLQQTRSIMLNSKVEVEQSTSVVQEFKNQYDTLKAEYTQLQKYLYDCQEQVKQLESQNNDFLSENEKLKSIQNKIHSDIMAAKLFFKKNQLEFKTYCDCRTNNIPLRTRLTELDSTFSGEKPREMQTPSDVCVSQGAIRELNERYVRIINLLQKKHQEEIHLYKLKLEMEQEGPHNQQANFSELYEKRDSMVRQLYNVTEVQWMESLDLDGKEDQMYFRRGLEWNNGTENS